MRTSDAAPAVAGRPWHLPAATGGMRGNREADRLICKERRAYGVPLVEKKDMNCIIYNAVSKVPDFFFFGRV